MPLLDPDHLSPTGQRVIPREVRQDACAFLVARALGMSNEAADELVSGLQAERARQARLQIERAADISSAYRRMVDHETTLAPKVALRTILPVE